MPENKIGGLEKGQGLRRMIGQAEGHFDLAEAHDAAKANYEIGAEQSPARGPGGSGGDANTPARKTRSGRWAGSK